MDETSIAGDGPGLHRHRHRPHDRPRRARRAASASGIMCSRFLEGAARQPELMPQLQAQGVPAARPDRRLVHHRRGPRDVLRVRQPARHAVSDNARPKGKHCMNLNADDHRAGDHLRAVHLVQREVSLAWPMLLRHRTRARSMIADGLAEAGARPLLARRRAEADRSAARAKRASAPRSSWPPPRRPPSQRVEESKVAGQDRGRPPGRRRHAQIEQEVQSAQAAAARAGCGTRRGGRREDPQARGRRQGARRHARAS